jgi:hypothetical protein
LLSILAEGFAFRDAADDFGSIESSLIYFAELIIYFIAG